jgi:type IV secretion system protein VirD4
MFRETLYRLPNFDPRLAHARLRRVFFILALDAAATLLVPGALLAHRWGTTLLAHWGRPWLALATYPDLRYLTLAACGTVATVVAARRRVSVLYVTPLLAVVALAGLAPLYSPMVIVRCFRALNAVPACAPALSSAVHISEGVGLLLVGLTLGAALADGWGVRERGDTHGSSHWASPEEVRQTGLVAASEGGVVLGAWVDADGRHRRLADTSDRHVLAFAPSGSGKTTCLVIPTLLNWRGSAVVLDIKGELWSATAGFRRQGLGQRCVRFEPSSADGTAASYNPLLDIPRGPEEVKAAQAVADVLVDPAGRDRPRSFWDQSAHALLVGCILHVLYAGRDKSLTGCAALLADPSRPILETLEAMLHAEHDSDPRRGWIDAASGGRTTTHPVVAASARSLLDMDPRTAAGIVATAQAHLGLFRDPLLSANTTASHFRAHDLTDDERGVSIYLTVPPSELERLRPVLRLVLNQLCRELTSRMAFREAPPARPILLLLDEFAALGKLDFFGRAMAYLRGFGIRVVLSIQSLAQLAEVYGPHQSILANCPLQVAFAPADVETAELVSKMTGSMTVAFTRRSYDSRALGFSSRRPSYSDLEVGRPLLTPEEVRRLPGSEELVFAAGHAPIRATRTPFFRDSLWASLSALPAPLRSDRIEKDSPWTESPG